MALHLVLCQLCHALGAFFFALVTQAEKWHAREKSSGKVH